MALALKCRKSVTETSVLSNVKFGYNSILRSSHVTPCASPGLLD